MKLTETDFSSYKAELTSAQQQTADSVQSLVKIPHFTFSNSMKKNKISSFVSIQDFQLQNVNFPFM